MQTKSQELTLEEYKHEISIYKNYREEISKFREELVSLEKEKKSLGGIFLLFYGISFSLIFSLWFFFGGGQKDFWGILIASIFLAVYPAAFLSDIFESDSLTNTLSFGKLDKIKKLQEGIQEHIEEVEELKGDIYKKLQLFEEVVCDHYKAQLAEFFEKNLYKKRSGDQQFEEALSEFSSTIEELSPINSVLITTRIPLEEYKEYLKKRTINHNLQASKKSESLNLVRSFVRNFSKPQEQEQKEIVAPEKLYRTARKIDNWDEINKKRRITGYKGEEIAVAMEQEFFISINRRDLADKVSHVSVERGDGLGYDILSFFENGKEKYIEVKTTKTNFNSPYLLSKNELQFLKEHNEDAFIYQILISDGTPQVKTYSSEEVLDINEITPVQYIVYGKSNESIR